MAIRQRVLQRVLRMSPASLPQGSDGPGEAKLELDPDYDSRSGYDPKFLGGKVIALPKPSASQIKIAAKNNQAKAGDNPYELKYHHYSVLMNGKRRLAFVSAANIDGAKSKDFNRRDGTVSDPFEDDDSEAAELWFSEGRIRDDQQTPRDFYQGQTTFDAQGRKVIDKRAGGVHVNRMFQQGHLTRRQDPLWGDDDDLIGFANADTFHVTNCAPQVGFFNMGVAKRETLGSEAKAKTAKGKNKKAAKHPGGNLYWRALEEYVLSNARADRQRVSVFTGPIFDDKNDFDWDRGKKEMKGFKAPREFWKLVVRLENKELHATALVIDQSPYIDYLPEAIARGEATIEPVSYAKISKYHVSIAELESRTGLSFGKDILAADTFVSKGTGEARRMRKIEDVGDMSLTRPAKRTKSGKAKAPVKRPARRRRSRRGSAGTT